MRIEWSPRALDRVSEIAGFIAQERPEGAREWIDEIFAAVRRLDRFPESGRVVPEIRRESIREVIHGAFRIIYRIEADRVAVLTVRHSRQVTGPEHITE